MRRAQLRQFIGATSAGKTCQGLEARSWTTGRERNVKPWFRTAQKEVPAPHLTSSYPHHNLPGEWVLGDLLHFAPAD